MQNTSTSRSTDFRRQKTITSKTPLTLYGRGFCASDGTPTTTAFAGRAPVKSKCVGFAAHFAQCHNYRRYRGVAAEACCTSWRGHLETLPQTESCRFLRWAWQTARHRWKIPLPSANCAAERCPKPTLTLQTVPLTPSRDVTVPPCGPFELTQGASRNQILPAR